MTAAVFQNNLFAQIQGNNFPQLPKVGGGSYYSIEGGQLGIQTRTGDEPLKGIADLKEISAFVREILADDQKIAGALTGLKDGQKLFLYRNLSNISHRIDSHNEKTDSSFLIGFLHVILLIFTLGCFKYRDTLHVENFTTPLDKMGITKEQLSGLRFLSLLEMGKEDRAAVLDKTGLLDSWNAFTEKYPQFLKEARGMGGLFLQHLRLETLQRAASFEQSPLMLILPEEMTAKGPMEAVVFLADVLTPYLQEMNGSDRQQLVGLMPKQLIEGLPQMIQVFQLMQSERKKVEEFLQFPTKKQEQMMQLMDVEERKKFDMMLESMKITPQQIRRLQELNQMCQSRSR